MTTAVVLALSSALLHAGWNTAMKTSRDRLVAIWMIMSAAAAAALPILLLVGIPARPAWSHLAASGAVHVGYALALSAAYDRADLSVAYPLARGLAPVAAAVGGVLLLGDEVAPMAWVGIGIITISLVTVSLGAESWSGVGFAAVTAGTVATYTLIDSAGVRRIEDAGRYTLALFVVVAVALSVTVWVRRPRERLRAAFRSDWQLHLAGGAASLVAYGLVLAAVRMAPVGVVAAARETSVLFGALGGWLLLGEPFGRRRTIASAFVVVGVILLLAA